MQVTVTKADVTLTQKDIATWGVPPQIYTYSLYVQTDRLVSTVVLSGCFVWVSAAMSLTTTRLLSHTSFSFPAAASASTATTYVLSSSQHSVVSPCLPSTPHSPLVSLPARPLRRLQTCSIQNSFQQLNAQLKGCLSGCAGQDFCKEYVKPLWKRPATPYASLWRLVTLPSDLAVDLSLARRVEAGSSYIYKPVYIPYPWMCAQEPEWVEPEYKPEPVTILYVTAGYNIVSSSETPVHALRLWLPPSIIAEKALITSPQTSVVYGN